MEKRGLDGFFILFVLVMTLVVSVNAQSESFNYEGVFGDIGTVYVLNDEEFSNGNSIEVVVKDFFKVNAGSSGKEICYLWIDELDIENNKIAFIISRDPKRVELSLGETNKVDIDRDNIYDILLRFDNINEEKAEIYIQEISEKMSSKDIFLTMITRNLLIYIIIACVVLLVIILIVLLLLFFKKRKNIGKPEVKTIEKPEKLKDIKQKPKKISEKPKSDKEKREEHIIQKAKDFVSKARKKGFTDEQIKEMFKKKNWNKEYLNKVFQ